MDRDKSIVIKTCSMCQKRYAYEKWCDENLLDIRCPDCDVTIAGKFSRVDTFMGPDEKEAHDAR